MAAPTTPWPSKCTASDALSRARPAPGTMSTCTAAMVWPGTAASQSAGIKAVAGSAKGREAAPAAMIR